MTSYGRNKNHDDEIKKKQEKANNSPSYRCAAINKGKAFSLFTRRSIFLHIKSFTKIHLDIASRKANQKKLNGNKKFIWQLKFNFILFFIPFRREFFDTEKKGCENIL